MNAGLVHAATDLTTGLPATSSAITRLTRIGQSSANVLWDLTHGVYYNYEPAGAFSSLVQMLAANGFNVATTSAGVQNIDLSPYQVIVICLGSNWYSPYTPDEVAAIQNFRSTGGGVLIMAENTDCPNGNISPISLANGTTCGVSYLAPLDLPFSNHINHPIFAGVNTVFYRAAGELAGSPPSLDAAFTPDDLPTVTVDQYCGLVVTGDMNFADNDYFGMNDNRTFALNIFRWLSTGCEATPSRHSTWGSLKAAYR